MISTQLKNQHLMWRAGFGPSALQLEQIKSTDTIRLFESLLNDSSVQPAFLDATDDYLKGLMNGLEEEGLRKNTMDNDARKNFQQQTRQAIKDLNLLWLEQMIQSPAQLREKMAFFWHGHFASRNLNVFFQQQLLDVIRKHALGSLRDLLPAVSKSASMLNFLNANQNRKDHPNENFARELMELFTLGRGHYSENDIKEAARAFTGWGANRKGEFIFRKFQHDAGSKTVLGKSGSFDGDEVIHTLLEQKQTALFIVQKIYRFFVNDIIDEEKTAWLADRFYASDYNISGLMSDIFTAKWFYDEKNIGSIIKSPIVLLAGIRRMLPMQLENAASQLLIQRLLGQMLLYPPNVAGWPGGKSWIDSSTLMLRMRLPLLISEEDEFNIRPKTDDDQMMGRTDNGESNVDRKGAREMAGKPIRAMIDWKKYMQHYDGMTRDQLIPSMNSSLLQVQPGFTPDIISTFADNNSSDSFIKTSTLKIMSTPEYQMC